MTVDLATPDEYFDRLWRASHDPWDHAGRFYETRKYHATIALLDRPRFRRAFEPACGVGLLTERLAARCDAVEARDRHPRAVAATRRRCQHLDGVNVAIGKLPEGWPPDTFDLIVLSEVLYYFDASQLNAIVEHVTDAIEAGGLLVLVHYRRPVAEHVRSGDEANAVFDDHPAWRSRGRYVDADFVLDLKTRCDD